MYAEKKGDGEGDNGDGNSDHEEAWNESDRQSEQLYSITAEDHRKYQNLGREWKKRAENNWKYWTAVDSE